MQSHREKAARNAQPNPGNQPPTGSVNGLSSPIQIPEKKEMRLRSQKVPPNQQHDTLDTRHRTTPANPSNPAFQAIEPRKKPSENHADAAEISHPRQVSPGFHELQKRKNNRTNPIFEANKTLKKSESQSEPGSNRGSNQGANRGRTRGRSPLKPNEKPHAAPPASTQNPPPTRGVIAPRNIPAQTRARRMIEIRATETNDRFARISSPSFHATTTRRAVAAAKPLSFFANSRKPRAPATKTFASSSPRPRSFATRSMSSPARVSFSIPRSSSPSANSRSNAFRT